MGDITTKANEAFRDYVTDGVPSSGRYEPLKSLIRTLFGIVDTQVSSAAGDAEAAAAEAVAASATAQAAAAAAAAAISEIVAAQGLVFTTPVYIAGVGWCVFVMVDDNDKPILTITDTGGLWVLGPSGYLVSLIGSDGGGGVSNDDTIFRTSPITLPDGSPAAFCVTDATDRPVLAASASGLWGLSNGILTKLGAGGSGGGAESYVGGLKYESIYNRGEDDRAPWAYADPNIILMVPVVGQSLAVGSNPDTGAQFTAEISGTTLTVSGDVTKADGTGEGRITYGRVITGAGVTAGTRIVSGSGSTWTVDISQSVASTTMTIAVDTARTTTSTYPDNVLMFGIEGESYGLVMPTGADVDRFVPCVEADAISVDDEDSGNGKESICTSFANTLYELAVDKVGGTPKILMAIAAHGGAPYRGLHRGTDNYAELLRLVRRAVEIAAADGKRIIVPGVIIQHGEANNWDVTEEYARNLTQWRANIDADVRATTGQYEPVRALVPQCNRRAINDSATASTPLSPLLAEKMDPYICCAGPIYDVDGDSTSTHPLSYGYVKMGTRYGYAAFDEWFDVGYRPLVAIEGYWQTSTTFRIKYNRPVTVDDSGAIIDTALDISSTRGFSFRDGSGSPPSVSGVALVSGSTDTLELTLSGAPTGLNPRFLYASSTTQPSMGRVTGPRGCIRTTASWGTALDDREAGGTVPIYDWACTETIYPGLGVVR